MPEDNNERAGVYRPDDLDELGESDEPDELDDLDELDELDDHEDAPGGTGHGWAGRGYPPSGYAGAGFPPPPAERRRAGGHGGRRGWAFALTAIVAAAAGFGLVGAAVHDVSGSPAASAAPRAGGYGGAPSTGTGNGMQLAPQGGGISSLPPGAMMHLEIGGPVTAVSATSITLGSGDRMVTAAVTRATTITGKVAGIGGIKVGDIVSASIISANGKLTADSIQDPASLPSGSGQ